MRLLRRLVDALRAAVVVWRANGNILVSDLARIDRSRYWKRYEDHPNCIHAFGMFVVDPPSELVDGALGYAGDE